MRKLCGGYYYVMQGPKLPSDWSQVTGGTKTPCGLCNSSPCWLVSLQRVQNVSHLLLLKTFSKLDTKASQKQSSVYFIVWRSARRKIILKKPKSSLISSSVQVIISRNPHMETHIFKILFPQYPNPHIIYRTRAISVCDLYCFKPLFLIKLYLKNGIKTKS